MLSADALPETVVKDKAAVSFAASEAIAPFELTRCVHKPCARETPVRTFCSFRKLKFQSFFVPVLGAGQSAGISLFCALAVCESVVVAGLWEHRDRSRLPPRAYLRHGALAFMMMSEGAYDEPLGLSN